MTTHNGSVEAFRRVTAAAMRAIARRRELNVAFGAEEPCLHGAEARLPLPSRELAHQEVSIVRGEADAIASRLCHHDPQAHGSRPPAHPVARAVFDAVEQERVEALGARNRIERVMATLQSVSRCRSLTPLPY